MWLRFFICAFIGLILVGIGTRTIENPSAFSDPVMGVMADPVGGFIEFGVGLFFIGIGMLPDVLFGCLKDALRRRKKILAFAIVLLTIFIGALICDYQNPIVEEIYEGIVVDVDLPPQDTEVQLEGGRSILLGYRDRGIHKGNRYRFYLEKTRILGIRKPVRYEEV